MELSISDYEFLEAFDRIGDYFTDAHEKNSLSLFVLKTSANEFDLNGLNDSLLEPMVDYSLSRKVKAKYRSKPVHLTKKAKEKFIEYLNNKGELGELLLYCFLESHLKAPKILSKLELKTSTGKYVNGADGVHFLQIEDGCFQLIFGESKVVETLTDALTRAFKSVYEFKNEINAKGAKKSGLPYEKNLISDHIGKETFSDEESDFIQKIIYPTRGGNFEVDHAFGVFVGYEITISKEDKKMKNPDFRKKLKAQIESEIKEKFAHIEKKIEEYDLTGHHFYIYILPFTDLAKSQEFVLKKILE